MGTVYRATDRLAARPAHQVVALKRLIATNRVLGDTQSLGDRLMLAHEFRMLASLRHPHIITVIDYGFEAANGTRLPYYTMSLLDNPLTIRDVAQDRDDTGKVDLVVQMLHALDYLHRRGVVHRDLKPANVLVDGDEQVKVLDFGLAVGYGHHEDAPGGTLAYMSPEALQGWAITPAADLYAVGVMLYELWLDRHPFQINTPTRLLIDILQSVPDVSPLPPTLQPIVHRLLEKDAARRYQSVGTLMDDLCEAFGLPPASETVAIRESFLQAADFVGRADELDRLNTALTAAIYDQTGSAWLIAGESGVGKSRLLEEIRTRALVAEGDTGGVIVLRGLGVQGGGQPYQLWRDAMRRLALTTPLTDLEAGILKPLVPDIATLQDRHIPDAPPVTADIAQQRLVLTIAEVFTRQTQPVLLLLEDLQWAEESLEPLKVLARLVADLPLLVIGTYRDDERPELPDVVPGLHHLKLDRLDADAIAQLSYGMLGEAGQQPQVIDLLQKETEGNAFFLVEVVRALAEDAGSLGQVGNATLPPSVFAAGIQNIVQHRLGRVPAWGQPLLALAAVAGREIDPALLRHLSDHPLDDWLTACVNAAVLAGQGDRYQFAHDKLRQGLLDTLDPATLAAHHARVAATIESFYADDLRPYYANLAEHYHATDQRDKALHYARLAGEEAARRYSNREALIFLDRALAELPGDDLTSRYDLLRTRADVYNVMAERRALLADLIALDAVADLLDDDHRRAEVALRHARYHDEGGDYEQAERAAQRAIDLTQAAGLTEQQAQAMLQRATVYFHRAEFPAARDDANAGLALARQVQAASEEAHGYHLLGMIEYHKENDIPASRAYFQRAHECYAADDNQRGNARALNSLANAAGDLGDVAEARRYYADALALYRQMGDRNGESDVLLNLSILSQQLSDYAAAIQQMNRAMQIYRQIDNRTKHAIAMTNLGTLLYFFGDYDTALRYLLDALTIREEIGDKRGAGIASINLAHLHYLMDNPEAALTTSEQGIAAGQDLDIPLLSVYARNNKANALNALGRYDEAIALYVQAEADWQAMEQTSLVMEALAGRALAEQKRGDRQAALEIVERIYPLLTSGELDTAEEILRIYWVCYTVLDDHADPRAVDLLRAGLTFLQEKASEINDDDLRDKYLRRVRVHRAIRDAWAQHQDQ